MHKKNLWTIACIGLAAGESAHASVSLTALLERNGCYGETVRQVRVPVAPAAPALRPLAPALGVTSRLTQPAPPLALVPQPAVPESNWAEIEQEAHDFIAMAEQEAAEDRIRRPLERQNQDLRTRLERAHAAGREAERDLLEAEDESRTSHLRLAAAESEKNIFEQAARIRMTELSEAFDASEAQNAHLLRRIAELEQDNQVLREENQVSREEKVRLRGDAMQFLENADEAEAENYQLKNAMDQLQQDNQWLDGKLVECVEIIKNLETHIKDNPPVTQTVVQVVEAPKEPAYKNSELAAYFSAVTDFDRVTDENRNLKHKLNSIIHVVNKLKDLGKDTGFDHPDVTTLRKRLRDVVDYMLKRTQNESFIAAAKEVQFTRERVADVLDKAQVAPTPETSFVGEEHGVLAQNLTVMLEQLDGGRAVDELAEGPLVESLLDGSRLLREFMNANSSDGENIDVSPIKGKDLQGSRLFGDISNIE